MKVIVYIVGFVTIAIGLGALLALPTMWLWNVCLVDAVNWAKEITWLQAWGLNILAHLMFAKASFKTE